MQKLLLIFVLIFTPFVNLNSQIKDSIKEKRIVITLDCTKKTRTTNPLYIIRIKDKKFVQRFKNEASEKEVMGLLQPEWIESIDILRRQEGVEKYSTRAEEGAILIVLKEDSWDKLTQNLQKKFK